MHCSGTNLKTSVARVPKQAPLQGGARRKVGLHQRLLMAEYMGGCRAVLYSQSSSPAACPLLLLSARVYRLCHILKKHIQVDFCFDLLFFFKLNYQDDKNFDSLQSGEDFERQTGVLQSVCWSLEFLEEWYQVVEHQGNSNC